MFQPQCTISIDVVSSFLGAPSYPEVIDSNGDWLFELDPGNF